MLRNKEIVLRCDCGCSTFGIDFMPEFGDEPDQWFWEIYHKYNWVGKWRDNLKMIWALMRGQDPKCIDAQVIYRTDIERLRNFLTETLTQPGDDKNG